MRIINDDHKPKLTDELVHYGVKGMKWGVRKKNESSSEPGNLPSVTKVTTSRGETITLSRDPAPPMTKFLAKYSKRNAEFAKNTLEFTVKDSKGKNIGYLHAFRKGDEIHAAWLGVNEDKQGQGYGSGIVKGMIEVGKTTGAKRISLEVPGNADNAKHIYEKMGFVADGPPKKIPVFGELQDMIYEY